MKAIPVVRPEDLERTGAGFITVKGLQVLVSTDFEIR
jgi:hypothetical protein